MSSPSTRSRPSPKTRGGLALIVVMVVLATTGCVRFTTRPVNSSIPTSATCASKVRSAPETRSMNRTMNATKGRQKGLTTPYPAMAKVDGAFTGTTDQIIQWGACKWGIDEDIVRAMAVIESWWDQRNLGDWQSDRSRCVPGHGIGADGRPGQCPASGGLLSITYQHFPGAFPEAMTSTAYNVDYVLAWWRACYNGQVTWMNDVEHGRRYAAGDAWGCVGAWYAGRWHTPAAEDYIRRVDTARRDKVWNSSAFGSYR